MLRLDGWLYLAFVLDAYSRKVVEWSMAEHIRAELVVDALTMAVETRGAVERLIHHSDRGSQHTSLEFGNALQEARILPSMGSIGNGYDGAMVESFVSAKGASGSAGRRGQPGRLHELLASSRSRCATTGAACIPRSATAVQYGSRRERQ